VISRPDRSAGRRVFGQDPIGYNRARVPYPPRLYELLQTKCGLREGTATFEIGPGTGIATRELLRLGAKPLVAIEPDNRLAAYLRETITSPAFSIEPHAFEEARLSPGEFELGVAATSFHWLEQDAALPRVACALRPNGWFAMWWNVFGAKHDAFYDAIAPVMKQIEHPLGERVDGFAGDTRARIGDLRSTGCFDDVESEMFRELIALDAKRIRGLFSSFSPIRMLAPERQVEILDAIEAIAGDKFDNRVERELRTIVYTARRNEAAGGSFHEPR